MIIAILSGKASAGKTTTAINLGTALSERGHSVQLVDLDHEQRDLTELAAAVGLPCESTLDGIGDDSNKDGFTLIECTRIFKYTPDGLRFIESTRDALRIAHIALIPTPCEFLGVRGLKRAYSAVQSVQSGSNPNLQMKVLATMYYARKQSDKRAEVQSRLGDALLKTIIPRESAISEAPGDGMTVLEYAPKSRGANAYRRLAKELLNE
jgi:chromosome partitioning protein